MEKEKLLNDIQRCLSKERDFSLFETGKKDDENTRSYLFCSAREIITSSRFVSVKSSLDKIDDYLARGYYAAGFVSYEAGYVFEDCFKAPKYSRSTPLLKFGIYKAPRIFHHKSTKSPLPIGDKDLKNKGEFSLSHIKYSLNKETYKNKVAKIKEMIKEGKTYQVNLTFHLKFDFDGCPFGLYLALRSMQPAPYSSFMQFGDQSILSLSPELFFRKAGDRLTTRPMKGTWPRGFTKAEDRRSKKMFLASQKDQSENIMIVDLLRNDLNRISRLHSVRTSKIFTIEEYPTLFQMTSTVRGRLAEKKSTCGIFSHIFPSGSVTGAPKISTMNIIKKLEGRPRGVYTGSIGFMTPKRKAVFNIAIRTLEIDRLKKNGRMGVGSGIVIDSDPEKEFDECKLKSQFLEGARRNFNLFETILWSKKKNGYFLLSEHLKRLERAALFFGYPFSKKTAGDILVSKAKRFKACRDYKVKLTVNKTGDHQVIAAEVLQPSPERLAKVLIAKEKVNSKDIFLYFKTTRRKLYDRTYRAVIQDGYDESFFLNEKNEVTEGCVSNIFIEKREKFFTPPVSSGLLGGIYRANFLKRNKKTAMERILTVDDLVRAEAIYLVNSVRGMVRVKLVG